MQTSKLIRPKASEKHDLRSRKGKKENIWRAQWIECEILFICSILIKLRFKAVFVSWIIPNAYGFVSVNRLMLTFSSKIH